LFGRNPKKPSGAKISPPRIQSLEQVALNDPWFEVYKVAPATFASPSLIKPRSHFLPDVGTKQALLFDTGHGQSAKSKPRRAPNFRPIVVLIPTPTDDHVGGNWQFPSSRDGHRFTRASPKVPAKTRKPKSPRPTCGALPKNSDPAKYSTKPWKISLYVRNAFKVNLGGAP